MQEGPAPVRRGERRLGFDPAARADATLCFIGRIRSPWGPGDAPRNLTEARARGGGATAEIDPPFRPGLEGLAAGQPLILVYWTGGAPRDLIRQAPAHRPEGAGVFALRSPARPNPVAVSVVRLLGLDAATGRLVLDATDAWDGTPLLDLKPWLPGIDIPPGESRRHLRGLR